MPETWDKNRGKGTATASVSGVPVALNKIGRKPSGLPGQVGPLRALSGVQWAPDHHQKSKQTNIHQGAMPER